MLILLHNRKCNAYKIQIEMQESHNSCQLHYKLEGKTVTRGDLKKANEIVSVQLTIDNQIKFSFSFFISLRAYSTAANP